MSRNEIKHMITRSALDLLRRHQSHDGFPPAEGRLPNAMSTAEVVCAAFETRNPELLSYVPSNLHSIALMQLSDGSWTDPNETDPWDASGTAWALWAFYRSGQQRYAAALKKGIDWLQQSICQDGGIPTNRRHLGSNTYATAYAYRVFKAFGLLTQAKSCEDYLHQTQNPDGGWGLRPGNVSETTLTAYVLHGLLEGGLSSCSVTVDSGLNFITSAMNPKGIWGSWFGEVASVEGTAFALYILHKAGRIDTDREVLSLKYIASRIQDGDAWYIDGIEQVWIAVSCILVAA